MKLKWINLGVLFFFLSGNSHAAIYDADQRILSEALNLFNKGAYSQSIDKAKQVKGKDSETQEKLDLFIATTYAKMQAFDKALPFYKKAENLNSKAPNLNYDMGQAYFATQNLKEAEEQFKKSIAKKFKVAASAYYVGYIRQLKEDREGAKDFYLRIQKLADDPDKVKQPALFQLAEIELEHFNKEENKTRRLKLIDRQVLPLFKNAKNFESDTPTYEAAVAKIAELERELEVITHRMVNGNPIPKKPYTLKLSQDFTFDSNVITQADGALVQVSDKDSLISKTGVLAKYQFNWRQRFSFVPELNASLTMHSRRSTPRVYQNDNISINPALRSKWEHFSRGKAATGLFDIEYAYMLRDYAQAHKFPYYSRSLNLVFGERVTWFATGSTTVKFSFKLAENYNPDRNALTPQVSFQQNVKIYGKYDLQNTFTADYLRARNDFNDEKNYKLRHNVTIPNAFEKVGVTPSLSITMKDTMKQKGNRGNELLINPSVSLSRDLIENLDSTFEYSFSKNYSKDKLNYQYTKHEIKLGAGYSF
jgi:tetratricopeptide (TPR) repeat protein